jgi:magnesium-transporting ATPase (P-type)
MMNVEKLGGRHPILVKQSLGAHALMEKLHSSQEKGLTPTDFEVREQFFSSNFKAPPKMTPYWRLFLNALDDFMLKFLSVCAVVQLVIEVSFADASHRSTCKCSKSSLSKGQYINSLVCWAKHHYNIMD